MLALDLLLICYIDIPHWNRTESEVDGSFERGRNNLSESMKNCSSDAHSSNIAIGVISIQYKKNNFAQELIGGQNSCQVMFQLLDIQKKLPLSTFIMNSE